MRGRGAGGVAATVAATVASKVNGGSMMKVSDDAQVKDKPEKSKVSDKKKEGKDEGEAESGGVSRWWGVQPTLSHSLYTVVLHGMGWALCPCTRHMHLWILQVAHMLSGSVFQ